jgi:hypothetical protein
MSARLSAVGTSKAHVQKYVALTAGTNQHEEVVCARHGNLPSTSRVSHLDRHFAATDAKKMMVN